MIHLYSMSSMVIIGALASILIAVYVAVNYSKLTIKRDHDPEEVPGIIVTAVFVFLMIFETYILTGETILYHYILW
jgi:hypothetical protein